jgi:hypothetical protein
VRAGREGGRRRKGRGFRSGSTHLIDIEEEEERSRGGADANDADAGGEGAEGADRLGEQLARRVVQKVLRAHQVQHAECEAELQHAQEEHKHADGAEGAVGDDVHVGVVLLGALPLQRVEDPRRVPAPARQIRRQLQLPSAGNSCGGAAGRHVAAARYVVVHVVLRRLAHRRRLGRQHLAGPQSESSDTALHRVCAERVPQVVQAGRAGERL